MSAKIPAKPKIAKPSKDTVYVDVDDEITAIIDKVENAKQSIVALVLPKRATMLQSIVNMRLLKRSSDTAGKSVVLITSEAALLPLAGAAGLHTARNLQSKPSVPPAPDDVAKKTDETVEEEPPISDEELGDTPSKLDYHRSIGELATAGADSEDEAIALEDMDEAAKDTSDKKPAKPPKDKKLKIPNFERFRLVILLAAVGAVGLIVFIIFAIFVLPKATITIKTTSVPVTSEFNLTTSDSAKALDLAKKVIPATLKTTEQKSTAQVTATGQQNNGDKASGTMVFYNCNKDDTLSGTNRTIPAGTGVSANGLTFITTESVTVAPSHFIGNNCQRDLASSSTNVKAQTNGAKYNLESTTYSVSGFSTISGTGSKMSGGSDNIITIVSQADLNNAKTKITSADTDKFVKTFEDQLAKDGYYVLTSTLKPSDPASTANPAVGQPATTTTVETKITYTVLTVKKADLSSAINDSLSKQVDKNKQKLSTDDVLKTATVTVQNQTSPTAATLNVNEDTTAVPIIDEASVKKQIGGKKSGDIRSSITAIPGVKEVNVKMSPFWVSKAPKNPTKIKIIQQQVKS
jgi:hypothetical protein